MMDSYFAIPRVADGLQNNSCKMISQLHFTTVVNPVSKSRGGTVLTLGGQTR